eukprot:1141432-Pelagomonas_calceolata.AAC.5
MRMQRLPTARYPSKPWCSRRSQLLMCQHYYLVRMLWIVCPNETVMPQGKWDGSSSLRHPTTLTC